MRSSNNLVTLNSIVEHFVQVKLQAERPEINRYIIPLLAQFNDSSKSELHGEHAKKDIFPLSCRVKIFTSDKPFELAAEGNEPRQRITHLRGKLMTDKPMGIVTAGIDQAHVIGVDAVIQTVSPKNVVVKVPFDLFGQ